MSQQIKKNKYSTLNVENCIKNTFDYYDSNKNGFLEKKEVKKFLIDVFNEENKKNFEINEEFLDSFIECVDTSGDGKITFIELKNVLIPLISNIKVDDD